MDYLIYIWQLVSIQADMKGAKDGMHKKTQFMFGLLYHYCWQGFKIYLFKSYHLESYRVKN